MALGYDQRLYILAFDHRGSFEKMVLGPGGAPTPEDFLRIRTAKSVIYGGLKRGIAAGVPSRVAGALVDEQYGAQVACEAHHDRLVLAMPVEKSGQDTFDFEYGDRFAQHVETYDPTFAKVLVRYNPEGSSTANWHQAQKLCLLGNYLHANDRKFLFELLVPATAAQLAAVGGDAGRYDLELRPGLMRRAIAELQVLGVEPDVWKIEGLDRREDCQRIAEQVRSGGRSGVGCVVLGRGADAAQVDRWLVAGAGVPGYLGFAIGRSIWSDAMKAYLKGEIDRPTAEERIGANYHHCVDVYAAAAQPPMISAPSASTASAPARPAAVT
jgi:myo-inositol catabolism protein IolC